MRRTLALGGALAGALLLIGCAGTGAEGDSDVATGLAPLGDTIRFAAGPCFGACPSYSVTVTPEGSGLLVPERFTAVPGPTRFTVTPAQYRRLRASLAPFRPATGTRKRIAHGENCERFATDMPGYDIEWTRKDVDKTELDFQSGCHDAKYTRLRDAIAAVPKLLQIEAMLKIPPKG